MENLIIIGSGPAGLTAAIYSARANLKPLVLEGAQPGGQLTTTTVVENWPGSVEGVLGSELVLKMREQAQKFGAVTKFETVTRVELDSEIKKVYVGETEYLSKSVIIATGARSRMLGLENEDRLIGRGVHTCATCDGAFYRDKSVIVVGGGDSAMEEGTFLTRFAKSVKIIHRKGEFNASKIMQDKVKNNSKIELIYNTEISKYIGDNNLTAVELTNRNTGEKLEIKIDGLFLAIGHIPNTDFLKDQLNLGNAGYITARDNVFTELKGVFVAGDVADWKYRQAITASGLGCMAALEAEKYLSMLE